ncbi:MAG: A24 family peptidase, partial [Burkholderiaceae bacterium]
SPPASRRAEGGSLFAALCLAAGLFLLYDRHGPGICFLAASLAGVLLLLAARIDAQTGLLPDALTLPMLWLGLALAWAGRGPPLHDALAGVALGYGFPWCLSAAFKCFSGRDAMGRGDFKLLAALGAWMGWQLLPWALLLACLAGLVCAMWRQRSLRPRGAHPFGPFLAFGGAGVFLHATAVHSWFC